MKKSVVNKICEYIVLVLLLIVIYNISMINVSDIVNESKQDTFINIAKMVINTANKDYITTSDEVVCNISNDNIEYCSIYIDNDEIRLTLKGKNEFENMNVCSSKKDELSIMNNCYDKCVISDIVDVVSPYTVKNREKCIEITKDIFTYEYNYNMDDVSYICNNDSSFNKHINKLFTYGITEMDLVKNNVIEGNIFNVCIPREINETCYSYKIYTEENDKYASVTDYNDECGSSVYVPSSILGIPVKKIDDYAFNQKKVNKVELPSTIKYIGTGAFQGHGDGIFSSLRGVYLTGILDLSHLTNLESIDFFAFADNGITKVIFPPSLKSIGGYSFSGNSITGELDLSMTKLENISGYSFSSSKITNVLFPNTIKVIGYTSFASNKINSLDLSMYENLYLIDSDAFANNSISNLILPKSIKKIGSNAFTNNNISGILDFSNNEELSFIGAYSFENNDIEEVILPSGIEEIGEKAFLKSDISNKNLSTIINLSDKKINFKDITWSSDIIINTKKDE